ncbi:hypothetical protein NXY56_001852 [Leishmania guyanensis]|uniref:Uncharacterized protein n=1 Tax=Leishmania guyanensis TaxID=5670 RepID=A0A1E1IRZ0_LEIGU|nr:hypothetical protein, conserved [Leishmania guyanensis]
MNLYTSDGLLVSGGTDTGGLSVEQGQRLLSIYRLFLQLHHAGTGAMRIKDMLKPGMTDSVSEHGSAGGGGDKNADRRGGYGTVNPNWGSIAPSMPESPAYTGSIAVVSSGTPYPIFLLSSNALPQTHRLRGFASAAAPQQHQAATAATKNNNRSANGCEEIALRWGLLTKQNPSCSAATAGASAAVGAVTGAPANALTSTTGSVDVTAATEMTAEIGPDSPVDKRGAAGAHHISMANTTSPCSATPAASAAAPPARTSALALSAYPSGWTAAELQVHTTKQVMVCTATELSLDLDEGVEDGNAPLLFCCSVQPTSA